MQPHKTAKANDANAKCTCKDNAKLKWPVWQSLATEKVWECEANRKIRHHHESNPEKSLKRAAKEKEELHDNFTKLYWSAKKSTYLPGHETICI